MRNLLAVVMLVIACSTKTDAQTNFVRPFGDSLTRVLAAGAASSDETQIKPTTGVLTHISAYNTHATDDVFIKCTNATAANTTPGSTAVFYSMIIPHGGLGVVDPGINARFTVALTCYLTTSILDTAAVAATSGTVFVNVSFN